MLFYRFINNGTLLFYLYQLKLHDIPSIYACLMMVLADMNMSMICELPIIYDNCHVTFC